MDYKTLLAKGAVHWDYLVLEDKYHKLLASVDFQEQYHKQEVEFLQKEIKHRNFHLARFAPWGLERKTPKQYEEFTEELIKKEHEARQKLHELQTRYDKVLKYKYNVIEKELSGFPAALGPKALSNYILRHIYAVTPNRQEIDNRSIWSYMLRAVELLREYDMVKKKDTVVESKDSTEEVQENVVSLKLSMIPGGRGGNTNWLNDLGIGCIFLAKKRSKQDLDDEYLCYQFVLDWKGKRGALLTSTVPVKAEIPVDMVVFSRTHDLIEIQKEGINLDEPSD